MYALIQVWLLSAATTIGLFTCLSLLFDGRVTMSTWVKLALGLMSLLGPVGTVLTILFLYRGTVEVLSELRKARPEPSSLLRPHGLVQRGKDIYP